MHEGQMTQSNYLQIDACPARIDALEIGKADRTELAAETTAREAADAKHDTLLADLIDSGAKNLLPITQTQTSITRTSGSSSVTAVYDKDAGTVTLTGQHYTGDSTLIFELYSGAAADTKVLPAGSYHMCGSLAGGSTSTYRAALTSISGTTDTGSGVDFVLTEPHYAAYRIFISGDCTFNVDAFRPMICPQEAWKISDKIVPYCPTLSELYAMVRNGSALSVNSLRQAAQLTATPNDNDTETEGETK